MLRYRTPAVFILLLVASSCSRRDVVAETPLVEEEQRLSTLHVADPKAVPQLLKGWHPIEQGIWRWTAKQFAVALKAPSTGKPATLELHFFLPDTLMAKLGSVTLTASANGVALPGETYAKPGDQVYTRPVPAEATTSDVVRVDFFLDKALAPGQADERELGVVVSSVGLR